MPLNDAVKKFLASPPAGSRTRAALDYGVDISVIAQLGHDCRRKSGRSRRKNGLVKDSPPRAPHLSDPKALLAALADAGAHFLIIGGVAMVVHGSSYVTEYLDILYARDNVDLAAVIEALAPFHPRLRVARATGGVPFIFDLRSLQNGMNFTLTTTAGEIDLFGEVAGIGHYEDAEKDAQSVVIEDRAYQVLSLAGLIRSKRAAGRRKDLAAIPELEHLLEIEELREREES